MNRTEKGLKYKALIREISTGQERLYDAGTLLWPLDPEEEEGQIWWWTEGNFGCDCNRELCWLRAGGVKEEDMPEEQECGHKRFAVHHVVLEDGTTRQIDPPAN